MPVRIKLLCTLFQLHIAAANAYVEVLEFLLENDADIDVEDKDGWKPIHAAACWGNVKNLMYFCFEKCTEVMYLKYIYEPQNSN